MLLSRNSGCKGTKFISNAEIFFYLFSCNRASSACFYVKAAMFLQESPSFCKNVFLFLVKYSLVFTRIPFCFYKKKGYIAHHKNKAIYPFFFTWFLSLPSCR